MWTVSRNKAYDFDLDIGNAKPVDWRDLSPASKLRMFFAQADWPSHIKAISTVAGEGANTLVLYQADVGKPDSPAAAPSFVVRLTNAPQRMLFADQMMKQVAKAKIAKSLVLALNWDDIPDNPESLKDEGAKLVHVLLDEKRRHPDLTTAPGAAAQYQATLEKLSKTSPERPWYLVVAKCFNEEEASANDPFKAVIPDPFLAAVVGDRAQFYALRDAVTEFGIWLGKNKVWLKKIDKAAETVNFADILAKPKYQNDDSLKQIIRSVLINKWILSNKSLVGSLGRVLAVDTLLRNPQRWSTDPNGKWKGSASLLFAAKRYEPGNDKTDNPVAVTASEAFMPQCTPDHPLCEELGLGKEMAAAIDVYKDFVLKGGPDMTLDPTNPERLDKSARATLNIFELVENFEGLCTAIQSFFVPQATKSVDYELLRQLYADDGSLLGQPAGTYPAFSTDPASPEWQSLRSSMKAGFASALNGLGARETYQECASAFLKLSEDYGTNENFDMAAIRVVHDYLRRRLTMLMDDTGSIFDFNVVGTHADADAAIDKALLDDELLLMAPDEILEEDVFGYDRSRFKPD